MAVKDVTTRMVLETLREQQTPGRHKGRAAVLAELIERSGQCEKAIFRALERDVHAGYLEYGMWSWGAWLTPEGHAELARLRAVAE